MDKDIQAKTARLLDRYAVAAGQVNTLWPTRPTHKKAASRAQTQLVNVLGRLQELRKPSGAALVRLAYVRAMRASNPQARLTPEQEKEVQAIEQQLDHQLGQVEAQALMTFRRQTRQLLLNRISDGAVAVSQRSADLEQSAQSIVENAVNMACAAGSLAVS